MANTIVQKGNFVMISVMDGDFEWNTDTIANLVNMKNPKMNWIAFWPNATGDLLTITHDVLTTGIKIFEAEAATAYDQSIVYYEGVTMNPIIDYSECSVASCFITFCLWPAKRR